MGFRPATSAADSGVATDDPRLTDARTPTAHAASHAVGAADALGLASLGDFFAVRRAVSCASLPRILANVSMGMSSGVVVPVLAYNYVAQTYSKIRYCAGTAAPVGVTQLRLGVQSNADGTTLAETANESANVQTTVNVMSPDYSLTTPVALPVGLVRLAMVYVGTSLTARGVNGPTAAFFGPTGVAQRLNWASSGYTSGSLPTVNAGTTQSLPLIELLP